MNKSYQDFMLLLFFGLKLFCGEGGWIFHEKKTLLVLESWEENLRNQENSWSKYENQQQIDAKAGNQPLTCAMARGKCSHHCTINIL